MALGRGEVFAIDTVLDHDDLACPGGREGRSSVERLASGHRDDGVRPQRCDAFEVAVQGGGSTPHVPRPCMRNKDASWSAPALQGRAGNAAHCAGLAGVEEHEVDVRQEPAELTERRQIVHGRLTVEIQAYPSEPRVVGPLLQPARRRGDGYLEAVITISEGDRLQDRCGSTVHGLADVEHPGTWHGLSDALGPHPPLPETTSENVRRMTLTSSQSDQLSM